MQQHGQLAGDGDRGSRLGPVAFTPGDEGTWFAAAKSAKLLDEAIALANRSLTRTPARL